MNLIRPIAALALVSLAACKLTSDLPTNAPRGVVNITPVPAAGGTYTLSPTAIFLNAINFTLPDSRVIADSCEVRPYPITAGLPFSFQPIDAGASLTVTAGTSSGTLKPDTTGTTVTYVLDGAPLAFTPGQSFTITTPGMASGFPAATVTAATPAVFSFAHVDSTPDGPLTVSWSPAEGVSTAMILALPYTVTPGASAPDKQIYCAVSDTGKVVIPQTLTIEWQAANPGSRRLESYKFRTTYQPVAPDAGVLVIAQQNLNYPRLP